MTLKIIKFMTWSRHREQEFVIPWVLISHSQISEVSKFWHVFNTKWLGIMHRKTPLGMTGESTNLTSVLRKSSRFSQVLDFSNPKKNGTASTLKKLLTYRRTPKVRNHSMCLGNTDSMILHCMGILYRFLAKWGK